MKLTTNIPIPKSNHPIDYHSQIMAFGSCFAENMGDKFQYYKFQSTTNPFGILFHPLAIEKVIDFALSEKQFTQDDIFFLDERWHCFDVHSAMSHPDKDVMLINLNNALKATRQNISEATHFIITLGTAWVYTHIETNEIVANCHKVPQKAFKKKLLLIEEIATSLDNIVTGVKSVNPNIHFIFTVSPVRHLKDGFVENQRSKANLIAAIHNFLIEKRSRMESLGQNPPLLWGGAGGGDYFPSFEIQMDELRDYRFYAQDMVHPNQLAIDYIWNKFSESYFTEKTLKTIKDVEAIQNAIAHKPFNPNSESHIQFLEKIEKQKLTLQNQYAHIRF